MFSAAPSRNLPEVDLTIPALISPGICFSKNACTVLSQELLLEVLAFVLLEK